MECVVVAKWSTSLEAGTLASKLDEGKAYLDKFAVTHPERAYRLKVNYCAYTRVGQSDELTLTLYYMKMPQQQQQQ